MGRQIFSIALVGLVLAAGSAAGQDNENTAKEVQDGHHLALMVCAICHVAAPDQRSDPILRPPAPPFATIVQRKDFSAEWLKNFLATTHRGLDTPAGMPNPQLADYQVQEIVAYMMSLRK